MASSYMENFKQKALNATPQKHAYWYRYVDDTFMVWLLKARKNQGSSRDISTASTQTPG
jgi:hypothetical protein